MRIRFWLVAALLANVALSGAACSPDLGPTKASAERLFRIFGGGMSLGNAEAAASALTSGATVVWSGGSQSVPDFIDFWRGAFESDGARFETFKFTDVEVSAAKPLVATALFVIEGAGSTAGLATAGTVLGRFAVDGSKWRFSRLEFRTAHAEAAKVAKATLAAPASADQAAPAPADQAAEAEGLGYAMGAGKGGNAAVTTPAWVLLLGMQPR